MTLNKRKIIRALGALQIPRTYLHRLVRGESLRVRTSALKPSLIEANKEERVEALLRIIGLILTKSCSAFNRKAKLLLPSNKCVTTSPFSKIE